MATKTRSSISEFRRATARRLRKNATGPELLLWRGLRRFEAKGTHFRRQVPIGPYIADFACLAARLVIELDGGHHNDDAMRYQDARRTRWLENEGDRVIRFWNNDVHHNLAGVLDVIYAAIYGDRDAEPRTLSHTRRRRTET